MATGLNSTSRFKRGHGNPPKKFTKHDISSILRNIYKDDAWAEEKLELFPEGEYTRDDISRMIGLSTAIVTKYSKRNPETNEICTHEEYRIILARTKGRTPPKLREKFGKEKIKEILRLAYEDDAKFLEALDSFKDGREYSGIGISKVGRIQLSKVYRTIRKLEGKKGVQKKRSQTQKQQKDADFRTRSGRAGIRRFIHQGGNFGMRQTALRPGDAERPRGKTWGRT